MFKIYFVFLLFTINNIFITITNYEGKVLVWKSIGFLKTKGLKKLIPSFTKTLIHDLKILFERKNVKLYVKFKGFNRCKKPLIKNLSNSNLSEKIVLISDDTSIANNGCKLKKRRRL